MCYINSGDIMKQNNGKGSEPSVDTKGNGDDMPTVESVNYEMTGYLQDLEKYIKEYKELPQTEARVQAKKNLVDIGMIDENGKLTGFYKN